MYSAVYVFGAILIVMIGLAWYSDRQAKRYYIQDILKDIEKEVGNQAYTYWKMGNT